MKKLVLSIITLCSVVLLFSQQVPRDKVVLELFTGTWCTFCPAAANGVHDLITNGHQVAVIEYHWGSDPFVNTYGESRKAYYGVNNFPAAKFDGVLTYVGGGNAGQTTYPQYLTRYNTRIAIPSSFTLQMTGTHTGLDYQVTVAATRVANYPNPNLKLHFALTESNIAYSWYGMTEVDYVERLMVPSATGTSLDFSSQYSQQVPLSFSLNASWVAANCELVAFLQDDVTKEILQGTKVALNNLSPPANVLDAALTALGNVPANNCSGSLAPSVTLKNNGNITLTGADIFYQVNGGTLSSYAWTGSLAADATTGVNLPEITFPVLASNLVKAYVANPNGQPDQNHANDTITGAFADAELVSQTVYLELMTDNNPAETTWELKNSADQVLYSGGPYAQANTLFGDTFHLSISDCYSFTIFDAGGNGICCANGNGYVKLLKTGNVEFYSGGQFLTSETAEFKTEGIIVTPQQRTDGSMIVDIYYDLNSSYSHYDITAEVSFDDGATYTPISNASGDIGPEVPSGENKHVIWNYGIEYPDQFSNTTKIKINATASTFSCGQPITDPRDGKVYNTVMIGTQCWMKENLNVGTMINAPAQQQNNGVIEKYCYNNDPNNCNVYGGFYKWDEAMAYTTTPGAKGICPPIGDWHVPTNDEMITLYTFLGGAAVAGGKMKVPGTTYWANPNVGATNSSGFSALGSGFWWDTPANFINLYYTASWWTSSLYGADHASGYWIYNNGEFIEWEENGKLNHLSIRCIKPCPDPPTPANAGPDQLNLPDTVTALQGNTPASGIGQWSIVSGTGGNIAEPDNPTSAFTGVAGNSYTLVWTISTICASSSDSVNISFAAVWSCGQPFTDARDGKVYNTVLVGTQCWMKENLNVGTRLNAPAPQQNNGIVEKYCQDNNEANCDVYGGLYTWDEMMGYATTPGIQGICPAGWHAPIVAEWDVLSINTGGAFSAGGPLKEAGTTHWNPPNTGATNLSGFTGLPGGQWYSTFYHFKNYGIFWSSNEAGAGDAWEYYLSFDNDDFVAFSNWKPSGFSVRCIMDCDDAPTQSDAGPDQLNLNGTSTAMQGITPANGTGQWVIIAGEGGNLADPANPSSSFSGVAGNTYTLGWMISTDCATSLDQVAVSFLGTCGMPFTDIRDGKTYNTVLIGTQCWMKDNLNLGVRREGAIDQTNNGMAEKYCYNNIDANCDVYGGLYMWDEVMNYTTTPGAQGLCPYGWRLPTDEEFCTLEQYLDPTITCSSTGWRGIDGGGKLKETGTVHWQSPNTGATNSSGFTTLPAGYVHPDGWFSDLNQFGYFWSSTENGSNAWNRHMYYNNAQIKRDPPPKQYSLSVRCIRDVQEPLWKCGDSIKDGRDGREYGTVLIGDQCWMKENLNIGSMINVSGEQTNNGMLEKYCYNNDTSKCSSYGGLYQWGELMAYTDVEGAGGICPAGWYVPTDGDWCILKTYLEPGFNCSAVNGVGTVAGGKLKETGTVHWNPPNTGATNESGFTGLPGGERYYIPKAFQGIGEYGAHWASTKFDASQSWVHSLYYGDAKVYHNYYVFAEAYSVRCIKDCGNPPTPANAGPDQLNLPDTVTTLQGNTPTSGIGQWSIAGGTGGNIAEPGNPASAFSGIAGNSYTLVWTISTICASSSDSVNISFAGDWTCGQPFTDARDGKSYNTVLIGSQCWMKENLNVGTRIAGTTNQTDNGIIEKYCYDNSEANCDMYGGLYVWDELMGYTATPGGQGICPPGWHVPITDEWDVAGITNGGPSMAGGPMKETGTTHWNPPNTGATNLSGFTGLPGGVFNQTYYFKSQYGIFWTSNEINTTNAWEYYLSFDNDDLLNYSNTRISAFSARCVKDCPDPPTQSNAGPDQLNMPGTSTTLQGNTPANGTGQWVIISGSGGVVAEPANPTSSFSGIAGNTYELGWIISTACATSLDKVNISFVAGCGTPITDIRDGKTYNTVLIGSQCWLKENMNIGYRIDGTANQTNNGNIEKYCYNNKEDSCNVYGGLYQWDETMQYVTTEGTRGICPAGWHVPAEAEYVALMDFAGGPNLAGGNLKETTFRYWASPNAGATNTTGFSARGAGHRETLNGGFYNVRWYCNFHSSREGDATNNVVFSPRFDIDDLLFGNSPKTNGLSVRCTRDCASPVSTPDAGPDQIEVPGTTTTLQGNTPALGTGEWVIVQGTGGGIEQPANPSSDFDGVKGQTYILAWTISSSCTSQADNVTISFAADCGQPFTDLRDGKTYQTVLVGTQCWMKQELNFGNRINSSVNQEQNGTPEKYCYNNTEDSCNVYGGLYLWNEMMDYTTQEGARGICPIGWHIPSHAEFNLLAGTLGGGGVAGGKMKEIGFRYWASPNAGATNESGFSSRGGGNRSTNGGTYNVRLYGNFSTSTQYNSSEAWIHSTRYDQPDLLNGHDTKLNGISVRCVKNCPDPPTQSNAGPDQLNLPDTVTTLQGNTPTSGTGQWSIYSGTGGVVAEPGNPASSFSGIAGNSYTLVWTISTICASSSDSVNISFAGDWTCGQPFTDVRDGKVYNTVLIGDQCWMKENLNIGNMISVSTNQTNNGVIEKFCYNNVQDSCDVFGGWYQWNEAMSYTTASGATGICPAGWHLPGGTEWTELGNFLGGNDVAGGKLKATGFRYWKPPNTGATNETGFSAYGASRSTGGAFSGWGEGGYFWTSDQFDANGAWIRGMYWVNTLLDPYYVGKNDSRSVRCIKDTPPPTWDCGDPIMDARDGRVYNTIEIGTQCWIKENLNIGSMIQGSGNQADNGVMEKYCYDNNTSNCDVYGGLYQWNEMMQYVTTPGVQGVCPEGWYLPADNDWCTLLTFLDNTVNCSVMADYTGTDAGGKLKETGTIHWTSPNAGASNSSEFTGLPGGLRLTSGAFSDWHGYGHFWTSTQNDGVNGIRQQLSFDDPRSRRSYNTKEYGMTVRCIKEAQNLPPAAPTDPNPPNNSTSQQINTQLSWTCTDPETDPLTYDVYFGTSNPPVQVSTGQSVTTFNPGTLAYSTTYYWKIVAHDDHSNTTEGPVWTFTTMAQPSWQCGDAFIDPRDSQAYNSVQIGTQCWMAENLNIGNMIQGSSNQADNGVIEKYCYENNTTNCDVYGGLYQWNEMMQYVTTAGVQGICPDGWHLPADNDYCTLTLFIDPTVNCSFLGWNGTDVGAKMKSVSGWNSGGNGSNTSGFTALPGGNRLLNTSFGDIGNNGDFWTSSQSDANNAYDRILQFNHDDIYRAYNDKNYGFSVRCIKETVNQPPAAPSDPDPVNNSTNQQINTQLSWTCTDPETDPLTYDVYFGATNPPAQVSTGQSANTYNPGTLAYSTTYYWKIIAHDDHSNTTEGPVWSFTTMTQPVWQCGDSIVDTRDGKVYHTLQLGTQCWMKENMRIGSLVDLTANQTNNGVIEKYCGNMYVCEPCGGLYQWDEAMQYSTTPGAQGICPPGWHIPTDGEWQTLEDDYLGGYGQGGKLKETGNDFWYSPNLGATNESGFTARGGGERLANGSWAYVFEYGVYWSSNDAPYDFAFVRYLQNATTTITRTDWPQVWGHSVRCMKNQ